MWFQNAPLQTYTHKTCNMKGFTRINTLALYVSDTIISYLPFLYLYFLPLISRIKVSSTSNLHFICSTEKTSRSWQSQLPAQRSDRQAKYKEWKYIEEERVYSRLDLLPGSATKLFFTPNCLDTYISPGGTSRLGGRGAWPQNSPLKFLLEPQILPPKM